MFHGGAVAPHALVPSPAGFYDECLRKYGTVNVWRYCTEVGEKEDC